MVEGVSLEIEEVVAPLEFEAGAEEEEYSLEFELAGKPLNL